jgi:peptidoglycan/LPS O-acetylase OafA/YrhL
MNIGVDSAVPAGQLDALTGSRFVAASAILILHGQDLGYTLPPWLDLAQAVSYFFVLSGFILAYRYPALADRHAVGRFYWARFARIWPVHAFCVVLGIATVPAVFWGSADAIVWAVIPLQLLLVNAWIPYERFVWGFNLPAWSISVEWFFYAVFPLLILRWPRTWHWKLAASFLLLFVLAAIVYATAMPATIDPSEYRISALALLYGNPLARLFEFTLGMTVALAWQRGHDRLRLSLCLATALELGLLGAIAAGLYWTGSRAAAWGVAIGRPGFDWRVLTATPLGTWACLLYAPLIFVLATGKGALSKVLATRYLVVLGESSYSLYMLHVFMLMLVPHGPHWFADWGIVYRVAVVFSATIGAAWVLWRVFERPSRQWLLRHPPRSWRPTVM